MKSLISNLKFAWQYAKHQKQYLISYILISIVRVVTGIVHPIVSANLIVAVTDNQFVQVIYVAISILFVETVSTIANYATNYNAVNLYQKTLAVLQVDLGKNILTLQNKTLDDNGSGVFIQRLTSDTSNLADIFEGLTSYLTSIVGSFGILVAMYIISPIVFFYTLCVIIILCVLENKRTKKRKEQEKVVRGKREKGTGLIGEMVRGARDIKMLNSENDFLFELQSKITEEKDSFFAMMKTSRKYRFLIGHSHDLFSFFFILILVVLLQANKLIFATAIVLYNYYNGQLSYFHYRVGSFLEMLKNFELSCERIRDILDESKFPKEHFGTRHLNKVEGNFEFQNVNFSYDKKPVLKNLSFHVNANETVAFVGKSGEGKSTIFQLLCKMYDAQKGKILIDGIDIQELDRESIRGNITIISQEPYIFHMSIKDNLRLVKANMTKKEMKEVCKLACLDDFIETLPDKYDTIIGEGGVTLSGGQKQRLAIARALLQKTEIILFDEATSALDNETQLKIQEAINNMKNEYTILIIAHRLSTIIGADRILYLEDGKIEAEGTHKELMKNCEKYRQLYEAELLSKK